MSGALCGGVGAQSSTSAVRDLQSGQGTWQVLARDSRLADASTLTEYSAETTALGQSAVFLRVGFIPRFDCATLITVQLGPLPRSEDASGPSDDAVRSTLDWRFDGVSEEHVSLIDEDSEFLSIYVAGDETERNALRLNIDASNSLTISDSAAMQIEFSLRGSRRSIAAAEQQCRQHEPVP